MAQSRCCDIENRKRSRLGWWRGEPSLKPGEREAGDAKLRVAARLERVQPSTPHPVQESDNTFKLPRQGAAVLGQLTTSQIIGTAAQAPSTQAVWSGRRRRSSKTRSATREQQGIETVEVDGRRDGLFIVRCGAAPAYEGEQSLWSLHSCLSSLGILFTLLRIGLLATRPFNPHPALRSAPAHP